MEENRYKAGVKEGFRTGVMYSVLAASLAFPLFQQGMYELARAVSLDPVEMARQQTSNLLRAIYETEGSNEVLRATSQRD